MSATITARMPPTRGSYDKGALPASVCETQYEYPEGFDEEASETIQSAVYRIQCEIAEEDDRVDQEYSMEEISGDDTEEPFDLVSNDLIASENQSTQVARCVWTREEVQAIKRSAPYPDLEKLDTELDALIQQNRRMNPKKQRKRQPQRKPERPPQRRPRQAPVHRETFVLDCDARIHRLLNAERAQFARCCNGELGLDNMLTVLNNIIDNTDASLRFLLRETLEAYPELVGLLDSELGYLRLLTATRVQALRDFPTEWDNSTQEVDVSEVMSDYEQNIRGLLAAYRPRFRYA